MGCSFSKCEKVYKKTEELPTNMFIRTKDGYSLSLRYFNRGKDYTILYCHSVQENYAEACEWAEKYLVSLDLVNVLVFDYCASQGASENLNINESCIYTDCEAVLWFITDCLRLSKRRIILFGKCIGSGVALYLTEKYPDIAGLVMQSSLTYSLRSSYKFKYSFPRDFYPAPDTIKKVQCPVLFVHGLQDETTNFRYIKDFHASLKNQTKTLLSLEGGHELNGEEVTKGVKEFLEKMRI